MSDANRQDEIDVVRMLVEAGMNYADAQEVEPAVRRLAAAGNFTLERAAFDVARGYEITNKISPEPAPSKEIRKWADEAMFEAEPLGYDVNLSGPRVTLIAAPIDPLGQIAAMAMMYEGKVARGLHEVTHEQRKHYWEQIKKTHLKAPFESVVFHFLIDGVTRSFTHQMVRQRTAVYAQESLRFAVKDHIDEEVALPPSLRSLPSKDPRIALWRKAVNGIDDAYHALVDAGVPAEDARGLLPHNITTRLHYVTNLRGLLDHAGNRLCTQAQFEWRQVINAMVLAIREYNPLGELAESAKDEMTLPSGDSSILKWYGGAATWQYEAIADLFRPVCYQTGHCVFNADFDRKCSIRNRVQANSEIGRTSDQWVDEYDKIPAGAPGVAAGFGPTAVVRDDRDGGGNRPVFIGAIRPAEWLMDPKAAR